jgi:hypothetical protein
MQESPTYLPLAGRSARDSATGGGQRRERGAGEKPARFKRVIYLPHTVFVVRSPTRRFASTAPRGGGKSYAITVLLESPRHRRKQKWN